LYAKLFTYLPKVVELRREIATGEGDERNGRKTGDGRTGGEGRVS